MTIQVPMSGIYNAFPLTVSSNWSPQWPLNLTPCVSFQARTSGGKVTKSPPCLGGSRTVTGKAHEGSKDGQYFPQCWHSNGHTMNKHAWVHPYSTYVAVCYPMTPVCYGIIYNWTRSFFLFLSLFLLWHTTFILLIMISHCTHIHTHNIVMMF